MTTITISILNMHQINRTIVRKSSLIYANYLHDDEPRDAIGQSCELVRFLVGVGPYAGLFGEERVGSGALFENHVLQPRSELGAHRGYHRLPIIVVLLAIAWVPKTSDRILGLGEEGGGTQRLLLC